MGRSGEELAKLRAKEELNLRRFAVTCAGSDGGENLLSWGMEIGT
jgi:hypothetical protein